MSKLNTKIIIIASLFFISIPLSAREIRPPLFPDFYPFIPSDLCQVDNDTTYNLWAFGFSQHADHAFSCDQKQSLAALIFGKASFAFKEAFNNNENLSPNIFILSQIFSPQFEYHDRGGIIRFEIMHRQSKRWKWGARASLPLRSFSLKEKINPCDQTECEKGSWPKCHSFANETLSEFAIFKKETIEGVVVNSFAVRFDLLNTLPVDCKEPGLSFPMVKYSDPVFVNDISISNQDVTDNPILDADYQNPVTVIREIAGNAPTPPCAITIAQAQALPCLNGAGNSVGNNQRARFCQSSNYTTMGNNPAILSQLWLVPSVNTTLGILAPPAAIIRDHIIQILSCRAQSVEEFFNSCCITFADQKIEGVGDLDVVLFGRYEWNEESYSELYGGMRIPTAQPIDNQRAPLLQPLGNNGHVELAIGTRTIYHPHRYVSFYGMGTYNTVLKSPEIVSAPFSGATIKNIGPAIEADISWGYLVGVLSAAFHPLIKERHGLHFEFGYQLYHKKKDDIKLHSCAAVDCFGHYEKLMKQLLTKKTRVTGNTLYGNAGYSYNSSHWSSTIFGGYKAVVRGRNIPQERSWYLGINVQF